MSPNFYPSFCSTCGKGTIHGCEDCKSYLDSIQIMIDHYLDENGNPYEYTPVVALEALKRSINQYNTSTGILLTDGRSQPIYKEMELSMVDNFGSGFINTMTRYASESSLYEALLIKIRESGFLPDTLAADIQAYMKTVATRSNELGKILVYPHNLKFHARPMGDHNENHKASGNTVLEAMEALYQICPDLRPKPVG